MQPSRPRVPIGSSSTPIPNPLYPQPRARETTTIHTVTSPALQGQRPTVYGGISDIPRVSSSNRQVIQVPAQPTTQMQRTALTIEQQRRQALQNKARVDIGRNVRF